MNNSLKLSYEMLFENGSGVDETDIATLEQPESFSPEEVEELLQERDKEWQEKLENDCEEAKKAGFEEGFKKGKIETEAALKEQVSFIREMTKKLDLEFNQSLEELKPHIAGLVFDITEKVLDVPFQHPDLQQRVQDEVTQLVERLDDDIHIRVTLSKADFEVIKQALEQNLEMDNITFRVDENHNPGEYAVETKKETIIKNFKKMVADFKESISFAEVDSLQLES